MRKNLLAIGVMVLLSLNAFAESYNISRVWAGGYEYGVKLNRSGIASGDGFSLNIDPVAKTATFKFRLAVNPIPAADTCVFSGNSESSLEKAAYHAALELQHDMKLVESFYVVHCDYIASVIYRTDVKRVNVTCDNGPTALGQSVYIAGNTPRLGGWTAGGAVKLAPSFYPKWTGDVVVENNTNIQWKCLKHDEINPTANVVWQAGANNVFNSGNTSAVASQF